MVSDIQKLLFISGVTTQVWEVLHLNTLLFAFNFATHKSLLQVQKDFDAEYLQAAVKKELPSSISLICLHTCALVPTSFLHWCQCRHTVDHPQLTQKTTKGKDGNKQPEGSQVTFFDDNEKLMPNQQISIKVLKNNLSFSFLLLLRNGKNQKR